MEEAFRPGGFLDKPPAKPPHTLTKDPTLPPLKREDVDLIVRPIERIFEEIDAFLLQAHEFACKQIKCYLKMLEIWRRH